MSKARDLADLISTGGILADGAVSVSEISDLTATAAELNTLDGITASTADLNNVAGINSDVQTQLDLKAPLASPTFTGDATFDTDTLFVDSTNNRVGIGTTSPTRTLHLQDSSGFNQIKLEGSTSGSSKIMFGDNVTEQQGKIEYNNSSDFMDFHTNASERMRIDSSGNVGIGTTSPVNVSGVPDLTVAGKFFTSDGTETNPAHSFTGDQNTGIFRPSADTFAITTGGSERMRITSGGSALFGTTASTLYYNSTNTYSVSTAIKTNTANEVTELALINGNNDFGSAIDFARTNSASNDVRFATINAMPTSNTAGSESGVMRFYTKGTSDTNVNERFRIGEAGQLGIGGANYGTAGQVLTSGGTGAAPSWTTISAGAPFSGFGS